MTDGTDPPDGVLHRLARHRAVARAILWFERLWVGLWPAAAVCLFFVVLALAGLFTVLPPWPHVAVLVLFALALVAALRHGVRGLQRPTAREADRWLENSAGLSHFPLAVLQDRPSQSDPAGLALWHAHVARTTALLGRLRLRLPHPGLARADRRALRVALVLLLLVTWIGAGDDAGLRLSDALQPAFAGATAGPTAEVAAWITPPAYTGIAPIFLRDKGPVTVPAGSHLMVSVTGGSGEPALSFAGQKLAAVLLGPQSWQSETDLHGGGRLVARRNGDTLGDWTIATLADMPPTARFTGAPGAIPRSRELALPWGATDDYGVVSLNAEIRLTDRPDASPLIVKIPLNGTPKDAHGLARRDLTANPWAGLPATVTLSARDALGQEGRSDTRKITMPERVFRNPVARALIEVRKQLTLHPEQRGPAITALRLIGGRSDLYDGDPGVMLNLGAIEGELRHAREASGVETAQTMMWTLAVALEEGGVQRTARALQQAQQAMREELDREQRQQQSGDKQDQAQQDKDKQQLDKRTQALRDAIRKHLQALLDQARRDHSLLPYDPDAQHLSMRDLDQMLQDMQRAANEGRMQDAQQDMAQLEKMLQQLQQAENATPEQRRAARDAQRQRGQQQMSAVQDLVQRESKLRDQANQRQPDQANQNQANQNQSGQNQSGQNQSGQNQSGQNQSGQNQANQNQPGPNQPGQNPPNPGKPNRAGQQQRQTDARVQHALRMALGELMQEYGDMAGDVPKPLSDADQAMQQAGEALSTGKDQQAATAAQHAVDALQKGGQQMGQQMAQMMGMSMGPGQQAEGDDQDGTEGNADSYGDGATTSARPGVQGDRQGGTRDPLGRLTEEGTSGGDEGDDVTVPDQMEHKRTRAIEEELRRRGAERARPTQELDYIDRLLKSD
jgi:uncharacterized protein (TIGR02302 family)